MKDGVSNVLFGHSANLLLYNAIRRGERSSGVLTMTEFEILYLLLGMLIGGIVGGWASWVDARNAVKKGLVNWKKE